TVLLLISLLPHSGQQHEEFILCQKIVLLFYLRFFEGLYASATRAVHRPSGSARLINARTLAGF
ncbi:MAG TPA: hypothetical protein VEC97_05395, partial [Candidatus Acidoferrales bacterium]|nr:hypothetical protein [Candidatus Acidoferrales bacterium]